MTAPVLSGVRPDMSSDDPWAPISERTQRTGHLSAADAWFLRLVPSPFTLYPEPDEEVQRVLDELRQKLDGLVHKALGHPSGVDALMKRRPQDVTLHGFRFFADQNRGWAETLPPWSIPCPGPRPRAGCASWPRPARTSMANRAVPSVAYHVLWIRRGGKCASVTAWRSV